MAWHVVWKVKNVAGVTELEMNQKLDISSARCRKDARSDRLTFSLAFSTTHTKSRGGVAATKYRPPRCLSVAGLAIVVVVEVFTAVLAGKGHD